MKKTASAELEKTQKTTKTQTAIIIILFILPYLRLTNFIGIYINTLAIPLIAGAICTLIIIKKRIKIDRDSLFLAASIGLLLSSYIIIDIAFGRQSTYTTLSSLHAAGLPIIYLAIITVCLKKFGEGIFKKATSAILASNLFFYYLQITFYITTGIYLDPNTLFGGEESTAFNSAYTEYGVRFTGFFLEPSIQAAHFAAFLLIYIIQGGRNIIFISLTVAAIITTKSTVSFVIAAPFLIYLASYAYKRWRVLFIFLSLPAFYFFWTYVTPLIKIRLSNIDSGTDTSSSLRTTIAQRYLEDPNIIIWGFGNVHKKNLDWADPLHSLGDHTFILNHFIVYGAFFGIAFTAVYIKTLRKILKHPAQLILLIFVLLKFGHYAYPSTWIFLFFLIHSLKKSGKLDNFQSPQNKLLKPA